MGQGSAQNDVVQLLYKMAPQLAPAPFKLTHATCHMQPELSLLALTRRQRTTRRQRSCTLSHIANLLIADPLELRHLEYPITARKASWKVASDCWARHAEV